MAESHSTILVHDGIEVRQIPGFEHSYARRDGKILSTRKKFSTDVLSLENAIVRSTTPDGNGYQELSIRANGRSYRRAVHVLVCIAFNGPRPDGMECRHLDTNDQNNAADNLAWGTPLDNYKDSVLHGKITALPDDNVREVRRRLSLGDAVGSIATDNGVSYRTITRIRDKKSYNYVN